jgi:SAM-dependent methyltransferase
VVNYPAALERYRQGVCRDRILHDLIVEDANRLGEGLTFLDIGCGKGFDTDVPLQQSLARTAGRYLGVEPDESVTPGEHVQQVYRSLFEDAPIPPASIHVAFAVMVLEHLPRPERFWDKVHEVLVDGGVFWALTVDARHWFCTLSAWSQRLHLKELYLNALHGQRGSDRYENYPTFYRSNTPRQAARYAARFATCECFNFLRVGQSDPILPNRLRPLVHMWERRAERLGKPGSLLAIRAVK